MVIKRLVYIFVIVVLLGFIVEKRPAAPQEDGNMQICDFIAHMNDTLDGYAVTAAYLNTLLVQSKYTPFLNNKEKIKKALDTLSKQKTFYKKVHRANCSGLQPTDVVYSTTP